MAKRLLNLSIEAYDDTPYVDPQSLVLNIADAESDTPPQALDLSDEKARLDAIAKDLDGVEAGLGLTAATIGLEALYGLEDANGTSILKRFAKMVAEYIGKFFDFIKNYGRKLLNANRYNVRDASSRARRADAELRNVRLRKYTVTGNAVELLMINGRMPETSIDVNTLFTGFKRDVLDPIENWMRLCADVARAIERPLQDAFKERSLVKVSDDIIESLEAVVCAATPRTWTPKAIDGVAGAVCDKPAFGGVSFTIMGNADVRAAAVGTAVDSTEFVTTPTRTLGKDATSTLTGDVAIELAKVGVALADAQVMTVTLYDRILEAADIAKQGYTLKFTDFQSATGEDLVRGQRANDAINNAMAYLSYLLSALCSYNNYLTDTRSAIAVTVDGVLAAKTA